MLPHMRCMWSPVKEGEAVEALGKLWHVDCFVCSEGGCSLCDGDDPSYFLDDNGRVYCRQHYEEMMLPLCAGGCGELVRDTDAITFGDDSNVYHTRCFNCTSCGRELASNIAKIQTPSTADKGRRRWRRASSIECGIYDNMGCPFCSDCYFENLERRAPSAGKSFAGRACSLAWASTLITTRTAFHVMCARDA